MPILGRMLLLMFTCWADDPEMGRIEVAGSEAVLIVDSPRPVDSAARTLAQRYGLVVNSEDPQYLYSGDMKDVTRETVRSMRPGLKVFVPQGGRLEIHFAVNSDGSPRDIRALLEAVVDGANAQFPFGYRLHVDADTYTFVPTTTRDAEGRLVSLPALLDRRITIAEGTRRILEHANLMSAALSGQTGFHVSCCQSFVAGYPWGMESVLFGARDRPAREVLMRLIRSIRGRYYYLERCDPGAAGRETWCFIDLEGLPR